MKSEVYLTRMSSTVTKGEHHYYEVFDEGGRYGQRAEADAGMRRGGRKLVCDELCEGRSHGYWPGGDAASASRPRK